MQQRRLAAFAPPVTPGKACQAPARRHAPLLLEPCLMLHPCLACMHVLQCIATRAHRQQARRPEGPASCMCWQSGCFVCLHRPAGALTMPCPAHTHALTEKKLHTCTSLLSCMRYQPPSKHVRPTCLERRGTRSATAATPTASPARPPSPSAARHRGSASRPSASAAAAPAPTARQAAASSRPQSGQVSAHALNCARGLSHYVLPLVCRANTSFIHQHGKPSLSI